jgi:hypothetical protein
LPEGAERLYGNLGYVRKASRLPKYQQQQQTEKSQQNQTQMQQQVLHQQMLWHEIGDGRESPGVVTRVVEDLMVFVEVDDASTPLGLVFKPDKIKGYRGEPLEQLGVIVGAKIPQIAWSGRTLKVTSVTLTSEQGSAPRLATP